MTRKNQLERLNDLNNMLLKEINGDKDKKVILHLKNKINVLTYQIYGGDN